MEHRWGHRQRVTLPVRLGGSGHTATTGWLTDVSMSGAYVKTLPGLALLARITVEVGERDGRDRWLRPLQLQGRVVRRGPTGIGIEWEEFAFETLAQILSLPGSGREPGFALPPDVAPDQRFGTLATYFLANGPHSFIAS